MEKQGDVNNDCGKHPGLPEIARNDPETMAHYPTPFDEEPTRRWIDWNLENYARYGLGLWVVVMKETREFIRDCGLTFQNIDGEMLPEVGYHIHKKACRFQEKLSLFSTGVCD